MTQRSPPPLLLLFPISLAAMADQPAAHTELTSLDRFPFPLAKPQAVLDASTGFSTKKFAEGAANSGVAHLSSCVLLPRKDCVSQDLGAVFGHSNAQSRAHASCFAHPHSVSADTNATLQADFAGLSWAVALSEGDEVHSNDGRMYPQQVLLVDSTMAPHEERAHYLHTGQKGPSEQHGHKGDHTSPCVKVNVLHASSRVCHTGSVNEDTEFFDLYAQLDTVSVNACEGSMTLHEEVGDSTEPHGSYEDVSLLHAACDLSERIAYARKTRGVSVNVSEGGHPLEGQEPYMHQAEADTTSSLQSCSSECSSAISMVSNTTDETMCRLDSNYTNGDAIEGYWTDAKHGSYLDYMETSFVKNLYGSEYCALDVCGQQPSHQASQNTSPPSSTQFKFKSWQSGDWQRRSMLKPPLLTCIPLALRASSWVNHFRHRKVPQRRQWISIEDVSTFCDVGGDEKVGGSPSVEMYGGGAVGHNHTSGSNFGDPDISSHRSTTEWRHESNLEQEQAKQVF